MKNPITALRALIATELSEVYTTLPGEVVAYDGTHVTARPALAKRLAWPMAMCCRRRRSCTSRSAGRWAT